MLAAIVIFLLLTLAIYYWSYAVKKRQLVAYPEQLKRMHQSLDRKDVTAINEHGMIIIYNRYLKKVDLDLIESKLESIENWKELMPDFANAVFNKRNFWEKEIPPRF